MKLQARRKQLIKPWTLATLVNSFTRQDASNCWDDGSANAGIQYALTGEIKPTEVLIASYIGAATANTGLLGTIGWNAAGGAMSNYLKGDDPLNGAGWGLLVQHWVTGWVSILLKCR